MAGLRYSVRPLRLISPARFYGGRSRRRLLRWGRRGLSSVSGSVLTVDLVAVTDNIVVSDDVVATENEWEGELIVT
jgi:hypothetical protein